MAKIDPKPSNGEGQNIMVTTSNMNELEKMTSENEVMTPGALPEGTADSSCNSASPAAENVVEECAVESSPALDIESVADEQQQSANPESDRDSERMREIHNMDKQQLVDTLKEILAENNMEAHREVSALKQAFYAIKSKENLEQLNAFVEEGNSPEAFASLPDELEAQFKALHNEFKEKRLEYLEADEKRRKENLEARNKIVENIKEISTDIDNINTKFPEFQRLQQEFKDIKDIPASAETESWKSFQQAVEKFYDNLKMNKELRDLDFKKNLEAKRQLIDEAKALENNPDTVGAFRQLQELHDKWRELGPVAKEIREEIWDEFKQASTVINKRHQEYFEQRKANELANEQGKTALCEEIEKIDTSSLKTFAAWDEATKQIIDLQKRWKEFGFASKKANNVLFSRFRKACDDFFQLKTDYFKKTKEEFNENLEKKIALCEKAEALKELNDVRKAADEVVKLQTEWKKIGTVPRKQSDAVWQRFQAACNFFFDERKRQASARRQEENANLAAKKEVIEKLKAIPRDAERKEVIAQVRELQNEWQKIGFVPFRMKDKLYEDYRKELNAIFDSFDIRESRGRINNFQEQMENMKGDSQKIGRERDRLLRACEGKKSELKTIENNMGFFNVKSSAGNSMLKDMERKIKRLKDEIKEIEEKISLLDSKGE